MTVAIGVVVAALVVAAVAMRRYLVRRDRRSPANRPLLEAPPSPYQSAKGFRLIDGATPSPRQTPAPPRLEPSEEYVFSDPTLGPEEVGVSPHRHDVQWALARSAHRSALTRRRRWLVLVILVALIIATGAYLHYRHAWFGGRTNTGSPVTTPARIALAPNAYAVARLATTWSVTNPPTWVATPFVFVTTTALSRR